MSITYERGQMTNGTLKVSINEPHAKDIVTRNLDTILRSVPSSRELVLICVGTDRSTGDALGPLVGTFLQKSTLPCLHLFGTLDEPVHAMNLQETITKVHRLHNDPYIVAVDACLGQLSSVGCIQIGEGPVKPGAGVNKDLPAVGNMHITGIVNVGGFMEYFVLQNTRLNLVIQMAEMIAQCLISTVGSQRSLRHQASELL